MGLNVLYYFITSINIFGFNKITKFILLGNVFKFFKKKLIKYAFISTYLM